MNPLLSLSDYEQFIYTLQQQYPLNPCHNTTSSMVLNIC
jgi:hypothetical protein